MNVVKKVKRPSSGEGSGHSGGGNLLSFDANAQPVTTAW
jgi:hypothetical protein